MGDTTQGDLVEADPDRPIDREAPDCPPVQDPPWGREGGKTVVAAFERRLDVAHRTEGPSRSIVGLQGVEKSSSVDVQRGLHALARLARALVDDDRFGNTMLETMGMARIGPRTPTHATVPPPTVPLKVTTTTTTSGPATTATALPPPTTTTTTAPSQTIASCTASVAPAEDGSAGDYYVSVSSNQPYTEATAHDASDSWTDETNGTGSVRILLYYQSPGESIAVTVGPAHCSTTA